ncbi:MAG: alpha/beta hydrolase [Chitinispirillaceae bacterium]|nr:alpha/beta hydrolase [Chitinispirillaceae bacterium]
MLNPFLVVVSVILFPATILFAQVTRNIDYVGDGKIAHTLNIYAPSGAGPFPVVIHYPGLAFSWSDAKTDGGLASSYNAAGFVVVGPNVSGGGTGQNQATYPTQIQELKATVRFLRANAARYKLDPKFIGVIGFSSGAWNTVMLATTGDVDEYTVGSTTMKLQGDLGGNPGFSSRVQAAWAAAAPTDFLVMDSCGSDMNHGGASSPEGSLIGGALAQNRDKCALANPITYISKDDPPIHLVHGTSDRIVPTCQSVIMYAALQKSGNQHEMTYTPASGGHAPNFTGSLDFFKKALAANKEGCLDPESPKFDPLATYCSTGDCCAQVATIPASVCKKKSGSVFSFNGRSLRVLEMEPFTLLVFDLSGRLRMSGRYSSSTADRAIDLKLAGSGLRFCEINADNGNRYHFQVICP